MIIDLFIIYSHDEFKEMISSYDKIDQNILISNTKKNENKYQVLIRMSIGSINNLSTKIEDSTNSISETIKKFVQL